MTKLPKPVKDWARKVWKSEAEKIDDSLQAQSDRLRDAQDEQAKKGATRRFIRNATDRRGPGRPSDSLALDTLKALREMQQIAGREVNIKEVRDALYRSGAFIRAKERKDRVRINAPDAHECCSCHGPCPPCGEYRCVGMDRDDITYTDPD